ncbi:MAG: pitrilysin family protein [Opitutaceae bacterium]|nr:pitrilysin family protein [Opitutaceae bacterium]
MRHHPALSLILLGLCLPLAAAPADRPFRTRSQLWEAGRQSRRQTTAVDGFTHIRSLGGFDEYRLDANGLQVLLMPDHSAPVFTFMVTYHVGSRNEVTGTTGATHLLEHLMFKGSRHYNDDLGTGFDTLLDRIGATNNASTWLDRTNYYEEMPSDRLELALQLESDRMRELRLREEDRRPEMTVVHNEFERGENDPIEALDKEIGGVAYLAHPYHHPTIGWRSDIEKVPLEKLRAFYDTFYWPNNATVAIIGDIEPAGALRLVKQYYGPIPASPQPIPEVYTEEPLQQGPRRVTVKRPGELGVVGLAYKVPGARHPDHPALAVLADILTDGKTSRLYRALTDRNLTISVDAAKGFFRDNTLFTIYARLAPGISHGQVEKSILTELDRLKAEGVTLAEVTRAISKEMAATAYGRDGSFAIASQLNEDIAIGDWTCYVTLPEKIKAVTPADVDRVLKTYFVEDQSTTGWFVPVNEGGAASAPPGSAKPNPRFAALRPPVPHPSYYRDPASPAADARIPARTARNGSTTGAASVNQDRSSPGAKIAQRVVRRSIAGLDVLTLKTALQDVVTMQGSLPAGDVFNPPGHPAVADLAAGLLDKGTTAQDRFALAQQLEDVGATIRFGTTAQDLTFTARCLKKDVPLVLGLLAEQLRQPAFSAEEFAKLKKQIAGRYRQQLEDTGFRAGQALARAIYPHGHPNRPPEAEAYLADLDAVTLEEIKAFHAAHYGPQGMVLIAVGDVDDIVIDRALGEAFAGWTGGKPLPPAPKAVQLAQGRTEKIFMPGKASVSLIVGHPSGLKFSDPDHMALDLATQIFGGGFFSSRLLATVRAKEGLTYSIGARLANDTYTDGEWRIVGTFAPELLDRGAASTLRELRSLAAHGVTADELRDFKSAVTGSYKLSLATSAGLAGRLLATVQRGLPLVCIDEYPQEIQALTLEQVNRSIRQYIDPGRMVLVEAGTLPGTAADNR